MSPGFRYRQDAGNSTHFQDTSARLIAVQFSIKSAMKKIICFGDTITEMGVVTESRGYVARLAERYVRRADVLARGFSGYTTNEAGLILDRAVIHEHPSSVIVFFGANDSVLPNQFQHVPVEEYRTNLEDIITRIACSGAWIILITPPPMDESKTQSRTLSHTEQYALACYEIGLEMNLPVIDLFHLVQQMDHWEHRCMIDGIHLAPLGMDLLYDKLVKELDLQLPLKSLPLLGIDGI